MKKLLLLFAFALCAVPADAEDLTPVKTLPITRLQPEKATCVLRSPYFASILNHKTTVRFVMNVAWFVDSRDDLVVDWGDFYVSSCCQIPNFYRSTKTIQPSVVKEQSIYVVGLKHNDFFYHKTYQNWAYDYIQNKKHQFNDQVYGGFSKVVYVGNTTLNFAEYLISSNLFHRFH